MAKEKAHIGAYKNGVFQGYVSSVSYTRCTFKITQDKREAKGYTNLGLVQHDIDFLTKVVYSQGYIFNYE